jgi:predicted anti-sigma-YlaC factor YlaD
VLTCRCFVAGLNDFLDGALDGATRARFDHHVADCPRCRIVCETTRKTVELYKTFLPCEVPLALESRVIAAIRARTLIKHSRTVAASSWLAVPKSGR